MSSEVPAKTGYLDSLEPAILPGHDDRTVTEKITALPLTLPGKTPRFWMAGLSVALLLVMMLNTAIAYLLYKGVGIWGINMPVAWGFAIVNFVWWIGIGHAGTLISAILLLLRQDWRTSINRFSESMTLFAVACAGMFPLLHLGRPWVFYWLFPYPDTMGVWPQFRSPLVWDVFAVSTYGTVSLLFWFVGLLPDLATMRDRAKNGFVKRVYGIMAMGWRGAASHWHRYETIYMILAGLATPLVLSVHTVVSFDFSVGIVPGWHSTIFPPYFVAGAIYSGFAMVLTLAIPFRKFYKMEDFITMRHLESMAKVLLVTGLIVTYGYFSEVFMGWYSSDKFESYLATNRAFGSYWPVFAFVLVCNCFVPQILWWKKARTSVVTLFLVSIIINIGMWLERYMIVVVSLTRDFMPSAWGVYHGTKWDVMTYAGTIGFFLMCMFLFIRLLPAISMSEMRVDLKRAGGHE